MRLFLAIDFDEGTKAALDGLVSGLRRVSTGTFTRRENHHLTLVFLGETEADRIAEIHAVMCGDLGPGFSLHTGSLGVFRRDGGDIYWVGLEPSQELGALQSALETGLRDAGFPVQRRAFRPHLTLGRRVQPGPGFDRDRLEAQVPVLEIPVDRISLMESLRREGRLVYRPVDVVQLT